MKKLTFRSIPFFKDLPGHPGFPEFSYQGNFQTLQAIYKAITWFHVEKLKIKATDSAIHFWNDCNRWGRHLRESFHSSPRH